MSEKLDRMKTQKEKAEQKLRYYQHQEKMLEHRIPELTRKARTHRLCTRGGMLESFLICPGELTDDQVMELETFISSTGGCACPGQDDSRFARSPEHSRPFRMKGATIHRSSRCVAFCRGLPAESG